VAGQIIALDSIGGDSTPVPEFWLRGRSQLLCSVVIRRDGWGKKGAGDLQGVQGAAELDAARRSGAAGVGWYS
jgi:hypothetical protein